MVTTIDGGKSKEQKEAEALEAYAINVMRVAKELGVKHFSSGAISVTFFDPPMAQPNFPNMARDAALEAKEFAAMIREKSDDIENDILFHSAE